jgi:hypothetical protein
VEPHQLHADLQEIQWPREERLLRRLLEVAEDTQEDVGNLDREAIVADMRREFPAECPIMSAEYSKVRASHITWWLPTLAETAALRGSLQTVQHP